MGRILLFPVDDTDDSQKAFDWFLKNFHQAGDEVGRGGVGRRGRARKGK